MKAYIKGIGNISPQKTFSNDEFLENVVSYNSNNMLFCIDPVYKDYINPLQLRRMSRTLRMGVSAAKICLSDSGVEMPDAVITGTGFGCIEDTEKFLLALLNNNEQQLTPTAFMQSTHNTISGQVAIMLKCKEYNSTYVNRGFSFETALLDSLMLIDEGNAQNVLLGGFDENTLNLHATTARLGHWKKEPVNTLDLLASKTPGSVSGEGATFFMLSNKPDERNYALLKSLSTLYKPENDEQVEQHLSDFLKRNDLAASDIDLIVYGLNGDVRTDGIYYYLRDKLFSNNPGAYYKHLCGDYYTSSAFALWLSANILKRQVVPEAVKLGNSSSSNLRNILIINHYRNKNYSFMLVSQC
ncbi:MAG: beta-ketoacyl synthase chain length factor [Bacteroidia bacterium]